MSHTIVKIYYFILYFSWIFVFFMWMNKEVGIFDLLIFLLSFLSCRGWHPWGLGSWVRDMDWCWFRLARDGNSNLSWNQNRIFRNYVIYVIDLIIMQKHASNHILFFSFVDKYLYKNYIFLYIIFPSIFKIIHMIFYFLFNIYHNQVIISELHHWLNVQN